MKRPALLALVRDEHPAVRQSIDTDLAILRVPPSGTWERRRADLCALADDVIGPPARWPRTVALPALIRRYLAAFGPHGHRRRLVPGYERLAGQGAGGVAGAAAVPGR